MSRRYNYTIGSMRQAPGVTLAERAIELLALRHPTGKASLAITVNREGAVELWSVEHAPADTLAATFERGSDPDWLGGELEAAWKAIKPKRRPAKRRRPA